MKRKKFFKIFGITLGSILGVVLIVILVAIWLVFTPARLTPIARSEMSKRLTCESSLEQADLTFFSTFPEFSIHIKNLLLKNPMPGSPSDTLAYIEDFNATVDVKAYLKRDEIILKDFILKNTFANLYTDSLGRSNLSIVHDDGEPEVADTTPFTNPFTIIDLKTITITDLTAYYSDMQSGMTARLTDLDSHILFHLDDDAADADMNLSVQDIGFVKDGESVMAAHIEKASLKLKGWMVGDNMDGTLRLDLPNTSFRLGADDYLVSRPLTLDVPFEASVKDKHITLKDASLTLDELKMMLAGDASLQESGDIDMDVILQTEDWNIKKLLSVVPATFADNLSDITADGTVSLMAEATGTYGEKSMPLVTADLLLKKSTAKYSSLPYTLTGIDADMHASLDLNDGGISSAEIRQFNASTLETTLSLTGTVSDLLGQMDCDVKLNADITLPDLAPMLPDSMDVVLGGTADANVNAAFTLDQLQRMDLERMKVTGDITLKDLNLLYEDTISVVSPEMKLHVRSAAAKRDSVAVRALSSREKRPFKDVLRARLTASELHTVIGTSISADLDQARIRVGVGDFKDTTSVMPLACDITAGELFGAMDTVILDIVSPDASVVMLPSAADKSKSTINIKYGSETLFASLGLSLSLDTKKISIGASLSDSGDTTANMVTRWNPSLAVDFNEGVIRKEGLLVDIDIPSINFDYASNVFTFNRSSIIIDRSDFNLTGKVTNIEEYLDDRGLLTANMDFVSENTDIEQLMDVVSGFGSEDADSSATAEPAVLVASSTSGDSTLVVEGDPFMVPLGVDVTLHTKIKNASIEKGSIQNVGGTLVVKDGTLILEEMGFTSKAARMQLTAIYRSPRKNHLFLGLDFHLLDVDIAELIYMIPSVDTIVPMLKSFDGEAQFHIAAETYLKSDYTPKMSTLRGAAAIEAKDLVLMDSETFSQISKLLLFNKKTENKVDSLSVEMTVFRNEVDLYPFLFSMDKYQAVIAGRHNLDMTFDYHISVVDCPLPVRLGLEVTGNFDDMKYKLVPCKYNNMFKPDKRSATQERTLSLKKLISDALKKNVKPQEAAPSGGVIL